MASKKANSAPMSVEIREGRLLIDAPVFDPLEESASGKTKLVFSTRGGIKVGNHKGQPVTVNLNAYVPNR